MSAESRLKKLTRNPEVTSRLAEVEARAQAHIDQDKGITTSELIGELQNSMSGAEINQGVQSRFWVSIVNNPKLVEMRNNFGYLSEALIEIGELNLSGKVSEGTLLNKLYTLGLSKSHPEYKVCLIEAITTVVKKRKGSRFSKRS